MDLGYLVVATIGGVLLVAAAVFILTELRLKRRANVTPIIFGDDAVWDRVEKNLAAMPTHPKEIAELRADRALLQAENQVLRGELERVKRQLEERS